jgi:two-component system chemotaxis response regulator CheB
VRSAEGGSVPVAARPAPRLVVLGGSWGGLDAACHVLAELPVPLPVPVLLVLHRARTSDCEVLRQVVLRCSGQGLVEIDDKTPVRAGAVHLAPPDYHVLVDGAAFSLTMDSPVNHSRPSIDLAFESAAEEHGTGVAAVLLSGTGRDGAAGIRKVREYGGRTLVQEPTSAQRGEMPSAAIATGPIDLVAPPEQLGRHLADLMSAPAGARREGA